MIVGLHAGIDYPDEDETVEGRRLTVRGWAMYNKGPVLALAVTLAGHGATRTELATPCDRADVAELFGAHSDLLGWSARFDLADIDGATELEVYATVWGAAEVVPESTPPRRFRLAPPRSSSEEMDGSLEQPEDGEHRVPREILYVRGWAATPTGPVDEVEVFCNGTSIGLARLGIHRPDVSEEVDYPTAAISGFEHYLDLARLPAATSQLTVCAVARVGAHSHILGENQVGLAAVNRRVARRSRRERVLAQRTEELLSTPSPPSRDGLNLLVVTHDLGYGGGQLWLSELLDKSGAGRDFPCTVLSRAPGALVGQLERLGIAVHVRDEYSMRDIEMYEAQVLELGLLARRLGHNAVLVNTMGAFVGADVARRLGLPCAWAIHESWPPDEYWKVNFPPSAVDPRVRALAAETLASTPAVVFETEATKRLFAGAVKDDAAVVVPYGVDLAAIDEYLLATSRSAARRALHLVEESRVLLLLGTIEPRKAQTVLAQAFARVADQHQEAVLVLVGDQSTAYSAALRDYLESAKLTDRVLVMPVTKDVYAWYRASDVFVCASDIESLPRSILEVMAFGVPVLSTDVFGIPELIEHGETGWLFPPRSVGAAARALAKILSLNDEQVRRVGRAGEAVVRARHDSRAYAAEIPGLLRGLVTSPERSARELIDQLRSGSGALEAGGPKAPGRR